MGRHLRWILCAVVSGLLTFSAVAAVAQPPSRGPAVELRPGTLKALEAPEQVLPGGVLVHVRLKSAQLLLDDANAMAGRFIPAKALPPPLREALDAPNGLLALIGVAATGRPLSVEALAAMSGIDPARPATLSFYMGPPPQSFILSLPVRDLKAFSQLLAKAFARGKFSETEIQGGPAVHVRAEGLDMFIVCSDKMVCICGSPQLAEQLLAGPRQLRLAGTELVAKALKQHEQDNLLLVVDPAPLKPLLPLLRQLTSVPDGAIQGLRAQFLGGMNPAQLARLNLEARRYFGARDVEQLLDYVECLATGTYEVLAERLLSEASNFEGAAIAVDLSSNYQRFRLTVYSKSIAAAAAARPLPLGEVGRAVAKLPGSHNSLVLTGQNPPAEKSQLLSDILRRVGKKMKAKELPMNLHEVLSRAYADYQPDQPLESKVPWTVTTHAPSPGYKSPIDHGSLASYIAALGEQWTSPGNIVQVAAFPRQQPGFLEKFYRGQAEASNHNDRVFRRLLSDLGFGPPSYQRESRFAVDQLANGVVKLVRENSYTTNWGLFGYNEHELINRSFTLARDVDNVTLIYPGGTEPSVLVDYEEQPVPKGVKRLLAEASVPSDANRVEILRVLQSVIALADTLAELESLMHKDLAKYLERAEAIRQEGGSEEEVMARLADLETPLEVFELKQMDDGGFFVRTPVMLAYPRPKIMPELLQLLSEYREVADAQGGAAVYERTIDGQYEVVVVQSTEALATLVRTVGNRVVERYVDNPAGRERLLGLFRTPLDEHAWRNTTVLVNPTWEFLPRF